MSSRKRLPMLRARLRLIARHGVFLFALSLVPFPTGSNAQTLDVNDMLGIAREVLRLDQQRQAQEAQPAPEIRPPRPAEIREAQRLLNAVGYDAGPVDGIYGRRTRQALIAFQYSVGLPANGAISGQVLTRLRQAARQKASGDPLHLSANCTSINFARGAKNTVITGLAPADGMICYSLAAESGQVVSIRVVKGRNVIFTIPDLVDADNRYKFTARTKTYRILVGQLMRSVTDQPFRIRIGLTGDARRVVAEDKRRIADAQLFLSQLGYDPGPVDGVFGRRSAAALKSFERDHGFPVDGLLDPEIMGALKFASRNIQNPHSATPPQTITEPVKWQNETELRQKVLDFVADFEQSAGLPLDADAEIEIDLVDLNKDNTPEALLVIASLNTCGSRGCSSFVLNLTGETARSIGDFIAIKMDVLPSATGGWQDISLNRNTRVTFNGVEYGR